MSLAELSASQAVKKIAQGEITSEQLIKACLEKVDQVEDEIQAWAHLDPDFALEQARALDARRQAGEPLGSLHGVPVGIKDVCDTQALPTENGTVLDAGRQPEQDCKVVSLLRQAGAVIMGKTVTTELAVFAPGKTRNPHNPKHTPGGSSSGSCAAVATHMVPLAIGTQTNGSVIRPASYCGILGFKPSHGRIPRTGVLSLSPPLDTMGTFARTLDDIALLSEALMAFDAGDKHSQLRARPPLGLAVATEPPATLRIGFCKTPVWDQADVETRQAFHHLADELGKDCREVVLPEPFDHTVHMHRNIMYADLAKSYAGYYQRGRDQLSDTLCEMIEFGRHISAVDYNTARDGQQRLNTCLNNIFDDFDMIVTPSTTGVAPVGLGSTGNPVFNTLATFCQIPAITLPLISGAGGLPLGVQVLGPRGGDARLLGNANWLMQHVSG